MLTHYGDSSAVCRNRSCLGTEKFGRELLVSFAPLGAIDVLVTDAAPDAELAAALADAEVEVWLA